MTDKDALAEDEALKILLDAIEWVKSRPAFTIPKRTELDLLADMKCPEVIQ